MKKSLVVVLSMLFVLGIYATAFAIHAEIPSETQAVVAKGATQVTIGGDVRVRGEFTNNVVDFDDDAISSVTSGVRGLKDRRASYDQRVRLSVGAVDGPTSGMIMVESGSGNADTYTWGNFNDKAGGVEILEAWMQHKFDTVGLKVGHMPLALGNKLFFDHTKFGDDAIVVFADPSKELHIGLLTVKFSEGDTQLNDDLNGYVGLFTYKTGGFGLGGDVTYLDNQTNEMHFWNVGLRANTTIGGFGLMGDVEFQTGDAAAGIDQSAWAVMVSADYKLDALKLSAAVAYGTGDDDTGDNDNEVFTAFLGTDKHYTYVYEYTTATAGGANASGLANTMYAMVGVDTSPSKDLNLNAQVYWLRASEDVAGEDEIGIEIDAKASYKLAKNLTYWVEGGYLMAGDAIDPDADNAYAVRHGLQFSF